MPSDRKGFSGSIGGASDAAPINSHAIIEGDGKFDKTRAQPDKGAASQVGPYSHVPVSSKDPRVSGAGPSPSGSPGHSTRRK
jgi:hypothetical protein